MTEKYLIDRAVSWLQRNSFIMLLSGIAALLLAFFKSPQLQAYTCTISGVKNLFTGYDNQYKETSLWKIAYLQHFLVIIGFWSGAIGGFNFDGNTSIFLPYASFFTGSIGVVAYILSKGR